MMRLLGQFKQRILSDSLYRNSIFLMASTFVVSISGFLYWAFAAHLYSTKFVGLAATLVAVSSVVMILSTLGYDNSFIRFLPRAKNRTEQLDNGFTVTTITSVVVSLIYMLGIHFFVPKLNFVDSTLLWMGFFVFFMVVNMLNFLTNYPFIAERITHVVLIINTGMGILRLILLFVFARLGFVGLLLSHVLALFVALIATFYAMRQYMQYRFRLRLNLGELKKTWKYIFNSYVSMVFLTLPTYILPTFVIGKLGAASAAYYYIVAVIIAALNVIPMATSQSLFAEGAWSDQKLSRELRKAAKITYLLTIPASVGLVIMGKFVLTIFGGSYATFGYPLLIMLVVAGVPKCLSYLFSTILRIEHKTAQVAVIYAVYAAVVLGGSYWGIKDGLGIVTVGWATLAAEILTALLFWLTYVRRGKIQSGSDEVLVPTLVN
ncbi:MAG TPA: hypothetical protein VLG92_00990 [Candidatus Saccharimonadia bacterium]|nr:hypothetical protein [Candidatus Saccharimonadia bacterium]